VLAQYPSTTGLIHDMRPLVEPIHAKNALLCVASDLLALTCCRRPAKWGADVVVGNSQRFGVPMGYGGPHAGFFATKDEFKRTMPGRLVGATIDAQGGHAYRLALADARAAHPREKATSNICTAQVLLAVIASMYAVYHGPDGLRRIARRVHRLTSILKEGLGAARPFRCSRRTSSTRCW
jgi:glycine dehydrogenase